MLNCAWCSLSFLRVWRSKTSAAASLTDWPSAPSSTSSTLRSTTSMSWIPRTSDTTSSWPSTASNTRTCLTPSALAAFFKSSGRFIDMIPIPFWLWNWPPRPKLDKQFLFHNRSESRWEIEMRTVAYLFGQLFYQRIHIQNFSIKLFRIWHEILHGSLFDMLLGDAARFNPFTPKLKKYILPTF